jgi:hypothetical protein
MINLNANGCSCVPQPRCSRVVVGARVSVQVELSDSAFGSDLGGAECSAMTALRALAGRMDAPPRDGEFEVRYVAEGGRLRRVSLDQAGGVRFEAASPARGFVSCKGQRNFPGLWWSATAGGPGDASPRGGHPAARILTGSLPSVSASRASLGDRGAVG